MDETVKLASRIFSVNQSTFLLVLQKMTAWVMVRLREGNERGERKGRESRDQFSFLALKLSVDDYHHHFNH